MSPVNRNSNIDYSGAGLDQFYSKNRFSWDQLYESERRVLNKLPINASSSVLDVGCACGGLAAALKSKYSIEDYTGVEINEKNYQIAKSEIGHGRFINKDILEITNEIPEHGFDMVFSLSCIDWNVEFDKMLKKIKRYVKPNGWLICSLRFTNQKSITSFEESYQFINFDGRREGQKAPYIVLNFSEFINKLRLENGVSEITGFGFWKSPPHTAITCCSEICYGVLATRYGDKPASSMFNLDFPKDLLETL